MVVVLLHFTFGLPSWERHLRLPYELDLYDINSTSNPQQSLWINYSGASSQEGEGTDVVGIKHQVTGDRLGGQVGHSGDFSWVY